MTEQIQDAEVEGERQTPAAPAPQVEQPRYRPPALIAGREIRPIAAGSLEEAFRLAHAIHESGFAAKGMDSVPKVLFAILTGQSLGIPPDVAMRSVAVINGRTSLYGDIGLALIRRSGLMEWFKDEMAGTPFQDDWTAISTVKRIKEDPIVRKFSVADAKRAGLWGKAGTWSTAPERMLMWRSRWFSFRDGFGDIFAGMGSAEEEHDMPPEDIIQQTPKADIAGSLAGGRRIEATVIDARSEEAKAADTAPKPLLDQVRDALAECTSKAEVLAVEDDFAEAFKAATTEEALEGSGLIEKAKDKYGKKPRGKKAEAEAEERLV